MTDDRNESAAAGWLVVLVAIVILFGAPLALAMLGM